MKSLHFKSIYLIFCLSLPLKLHPAVANYYDHKVEGWHWYEDRYQKVEIREQKRNSQVVEHQRKIPESKADKTPNDPLVRLGTFKKEVDRLKAIAILNPTYQNVKAYMVIQKELMDRGTRFAQKWMEVVYTTPKLDYTLRHPTSQAARHVYLDQDRRKMDAQILALSKTYGLFFFYSSRCAYCKQFAPTVKVFSEKYHWEVLPISLDGNVLPEFPHTKVDNGSALALGIQSVPALLAVEPKTGKVIPLSYGMSTHDQIEDRIRVLIMKWGNL
ncbi:MAG: type-F conjugative transfer system pilin assembly protein TraF [Alphaproteobacteria bacterium 41-28]|nr:MAG: type-F conjugative transfer system pilin assembly protein TraF [Alphaproteobacteria bacterium 41-28]